MVLLNNRAVPRSASHLRGQTDRVDFRIKTPNPDRHSPDIYPRPNTTRHLACKDSSSPRFERKPKMEHMLARFSKKSTNSSAAESSSSDARTPRATYRLSGRRALCSAEPATFILKREKRRLPISMQDNTNLLQKVNKGNASYLCSIAQVYDVSREKEYKQLQYKQLVLKEVLRGFHTDAECEKYMRYLDGHRKRPFGSADPQRHSPSRKKSPRAQRSREKIHESGSKSESDEDSTAKTAHKEKREEVTSHVSDDVKLKKSDKHKTKVESSRKKRAEKVTVYTEEKQQEIENERRTGRGKNDRPKSTQRTKKANRKQAEETAPNTPRTETAENAEEAAKGEVTLRAKSRKEKKKITFLNEESDSPPIVAMSQRCEKQDEDEKNNACLDMSRQSSLREDENGNTGGTTESKATSEKEEWVVDEESSVEQSASDAEMFTLHGPEGTTRPKSRLGNRQPITNEEYMNLYHRESVTPKEDRANSEHEEIPDVNEAFAEEVFNEEVPTADDKNQKNVTKTEGGDDDENVKCSSKLSLSVSDKDQVSDTPTGDTKTKTITDYLEEITASPPPQATCKTVVHEEMQSDEEDAKNGNTSESVTIEKQKQMDRREIEWKQGQTFVEPKHVTKKSYRDESQPDALSPVKEKLDSSVTGEGCEQTIPEHHEVSGSNAVIRAEEDKLHGRDFIDEKMDLSWQTDNWQEGAEPVADKEIPKDSESIDSESLNKQAAKSREDKLSAHSVEMTENDIFIKERIEHQHLSDLSRENQVTNYKIKVKIEEQERGISHNVEDEDKLEVKETEIKHGENQVLDITTKQEQIHKDVDESRGSNAISQPNTKKEDQASVDMEKPSYEMKETEVHQNLYESVQISEILNLDPEFRKLSDDKSAKNAEKDQEEVRVNEFDESTTNVTINEAKLEEDGSEDECMQVLTKDINTGKDPELNEDGRLTLNSGETSKDEETIMATDDIKRKTSEITSENGQGMENILQESAVTEQQLKDHELLGSKDHLNALINEGEENTKVDEIQRHLDESSAYREKNAKEDEWIKGETNSSLRQDEKKKHATETEAEFPDNHVKGNDLSKSDSELSMTNYTNGAAERNNRFDSKLTCTNMEIASSEDTTVNNTTKSKDNPETDLKTRQSTSCEVSDEFDHYLPSAVTNLDHTVINEESSKTALITEDDQMESRTNINNEEVTLETTTNSSDGMKRHQDNEISSLKEYQNQSSSENDKDFGSTQEQDRPTSPKLAEIQQMKHHKTEDEETSEDSARPSSERFYISSEYVNQSELPNMETDSDNTVGLNSVGSNSTAVNASSLAEVSQSGALAERVISSEEQQLDVQDKNASNDVAKIQKILGERLSSEDGEDRSRMDSSGSHTIKESGASGKDEGINETSELKHSLALLHNVLDADVNRTPNGVDPEGYDGEDDRVKKTFGINASIEQVIQTKDNEPVQALDTLVPERSIKSQTMVENTDLGDHDVLKMTTQDDMLVHDVNERHNNNMLHSAIDKLSVSSSN